MSEAIDETLERRRATGRRIAGPALGLLAAVLSLQMIGDPVAALGAAIGAGAVAFLLWGGFVVRPEGSSYGRAAGLGLAATLAAFVVAAAVGIGTSRVTTGDEATPIAIFALFVTMPVMIAAALGLAFLTDRRGGR